MNKQALTTSLCYDNLGAQNICKSCVLHENSYVDVSALFINSMNKQSTNDKFMFMITVELRKFCKVLCFAWK